MTDAAVAALRRGMTAVARRRVLWLLVAGSITVIGAAAVVMRLTGFAGWDTPAHLYKIAVLRQGSLLWDNEWYGGAYQMVSYGFVFYWLAQFVNYSVLVVASAAAMPVLFYVYMRRIYDVTGVLPAAALAGVLAVYLANGQDPFLFALALTMAGMVAESGGRRLVAAALIGIACFANPVAVMVGAIFLAAQYLARPERRAGLRRLALYLAPFIVARFVLSLFFWEAATYRYFGYEILTYVSFGIVGVVLTRLSDDPQRTAKGILFGTFAVVAIAAAFLPANPMGGTFGRFFFVFGLPLFLSVRRLRLPPGVIVGVVVGVTIGQLIVPAGHFVSKAEGASTKPAFFAPALAFAATHHDPDYRFHVVALSSHWEAYYFPVDDFAITRGWYRQSDALHNELLNQPTFDDAQYIAWLHAMGVKYVFLPHAPLDTSGRQETAILTSDPRFTAVYRGAQWTIFRLRGAEPIVQPAPGAGTARVVAFDREAIVLRVSAPGDYLVKVSYSPYWQVAAGVGTLTAQPDDFTVLHAAGSGRYELRIVVTPQELWDQLVTRLR
ncbi:MAG TPA: hypothetical protein VL117_15560 [Thermoleophilia bacterium]|nr:hypothetical protein [Thermoleophilia bacterium]